MRFEQIDRLPEYLAEIGAIDLVDVEKVRMLWIFGCGRPRFVESLAKEQSGSPAKRAILVHQGRKTADEFSYVVLG